jgi:hypothetical protein
MSSAVATDPGFGGRVEARCGVPAEDDGALRPLAGHANGHTLIGEEEVAGPCTLDRARVVVVRLAADEQLAARAVESSLRDELVPMRGP